MEPDRLCRTVLTSELSLLLQLLHPGLQLLQEDVDVVFFRPGFNRRLFVLKNELGGDGSTQNQNQNQQKVAGHGVSAEDRRTGGQEDGRTERLLLDFRLRLCSGQSEASADRTPPGPGPLR